MTRAELIENAQESLTRALEATFNRDDELYRLALDNVFSYLVLANELSKPRAQKPRSRKK